MYYYAIINEEYTVMEVVSSSTVINDAYYIEITEEQYNDEGFLGMFYDQDKNEFVGAIMWMGTTNEVRYNETYRTLTGKLNEMDEEIATHTHTGYVSSDNLQALEDIVDTKADANHTHDEYAVVSHAHDGYATQVALDTLAEEVDGKADANHSHTGYASESHTHTEYSEVSHTHSEYATTDHTHTGFASQADLDLLEDVVDTKADTTHSHTDYASVSHIHDDYATVTALDSLESELDGKANASHSHTDYALASHTHSEYSETNHIHSNYAEATHNHDDDYADINHNHDSVYATISHNHDEDYATVNHTHTDYATTTSLNELSATVSGKANASHSHDDTYYTETEVDNKLATKADSSHTHIGVYDANGAAASALTSANAYTDSKIDALIGEGASTTLDTIGEISSAIEDNQDAIDLLNSAIANKANATDLTSHTSDTTVHITSSEREAWNAKSDFSGNYNDLTNKPSIPSIDGLATETYVDEKVATVTVESIGALPNTTVIPTVPTNVSAFINDAGYLTEHQSLNGLATETYVDTQIDAIDIPNTLSDLTTDSAHRVVTDVEKATWNAKSDFSGSYNDLTDKPSIPSISGLATETYVDEAVSAKANSSHTHSIANVSGLQSALDAKSDTTHNHDTSYDALGSASSALNSAKAYADELIADEVVNRDSAIATAKSSAISTAASDATTKANNALASAKTYADSAVATVKNDLLNGAGSAYDTLKELGDLIDENVDAIEALETVAAGKANASHTHAISDVTNLQTTLDGKAATSHGTHVSYSTTAPVMDGTASVGTATTVARSDHKHPTDTSRASQTDLDALETVVSGKANSSHTHTIANITNLQTTLDGKAASGHTHTVANISDLTATAKELNYMDGVTSNVQTQLDGKAASGHTHSYAGSSSVGGAATSANKLNTNAGSATQPVYFSNGVPVATTYTLGKSVPSNAVFTDTHYASKNVVGATNATSNTATALTNGNVYINSVENGAVTSSHKISGSGATTVTTDANGNIIVSSTDNNTTYGAAGSSLGLVKSGGDVTISSGVITVNDDSHNHTIANIDNLQSSLDAINEEIDGSIKSLSVSGRTITYTKNNGTTGTITTQDTTYSAAGSSLGLVKSGGDVTISSGTITVNDDSHNHTIANVDNLQTTLDSKSYFSPLHKISAGDSNTHYYKLITITPTAKSYQDMYYEFDVAARSNKYATIRIFVITANNEKYISSASVTYDGSLGANFTAYKYRDTTNLVDRIEIWGKITSWDEWQIFPKTYMSEANISFTWNKTEGTALPTDATETISVTAHGVSGNAATATTATKLGSSTVGGAAKPIYLNSGTATACSSTVGSATQPVYMNGGTITACTYTLGKSVPSNAVFTDTNTKVTNTLATTTKAYVTGTTSASTNTGTQVFDTGVYLDTTAGQLTATTFNGTTFSGSGVATVSEVETYLGI